jgi:hypothetical protein
VGLAAASLDDRVNRRVANKAEWCIVSSMNSRKKVVSGKSKNNQKNNNKRASLWREERKVGKTDLVGFIVLKLGNQVQYCWMVSEVIIDHHITGHPSRLPCNTMNHDGTASRYQYQSIYKRFWFTYVQE